MTSDNETVAEIVGEMREKAKDKLTDNGSWLRSESVGRMLDEYSNAIEAAHKREVEAPGRETEYKVQMLCDDGDWIDSMFNLGDGRPDLEGARDLVRNVCALRANERMNRITYRIVARDVTPWREVERTADTECEMTDKKNKKDKETR